MLMLSVGISLQLSNKNKIKITHQSFKLHIFSTSVCVETHVWNLMNTETQQMVSFKYDKKNNESQRYGRRKKLSWWKF